MQFPRISRLILMAAVLVAAASSCGSDDDDFILVGDPHAGSGATSPVQQASLCIEVPRLQPGCHFVVHAVDYRDADVLNYCLEFDPAACHSRWVAFRFDALSRQTNVGRSAEPFADDSLLPASCRIGYNGFGRQYVDVEGIARTLSSQQFDRGHLCASADRYLSREANEQTFLMSNMSPQISSFNSPYWSSFEGFVQRRGRDAQFADTLYVVKGGTIAPGQTLGYVVRPNGTHVTIPRYYFMALLKCRNNTYSALAFWMEHRDCGPIVELSLAQIAEHVITIDELEERTGLDFFHNLPDAIEQRVEAYVTPSTWGL